MATYDRRATDSLSKAQSSRQKNENLTADSFALWPYMIVAPQAASAK
jgi:hypothetical protein